MTATLIDVVDARVSYPGPAGPLTVLDGVSIRLEAGEVLAIVGPSGCGKTTLLRALQGLTSVDSGTLRVGDPTTNARTSTSYVFQQPALYPWWTVRRNVEFGLRLKAHRGTDAAERRRRVDELLDTVGLTGFADYRPNTLSGGMQQRVNLARALAVDPEVLLLDEPFSAVDTLTRERLQRVLSQTLDRLATAAIVVTHDIHEAVFLGDRVAVMSGRPGRIVETFTVDESHPRDEDFQHGEYLSSLSRKIYEHLRSN